MKLLRLLFAAALTLSATNTIASGSLTNSQRQAIIEKVKSKLADPYSAKIRITKVSANTVCGLVNAKNQFGGYVGDRWFIANWYYSETDPKQLLTTAVIFEDPNFNATFCEHP